MRHARLSLHIPDRPPAPLRYPVMSVMLCGRFFSAATRLGRSATAKVMLVDWPRSRPGPSCHFHSPSYSAGPRLTAAPPVASQERSLRQTYKPIQFILNGQVLVKNVSDALWPLLICQSACLYAAGSGRTRPH